jgi:hypothetical protein
MAFEYWCGPGEQESFPVPDLDEEMMKEALGSV